MTVMHRKRLDDRECPVARALDVIGASGAALDHPDPSVRAGFNLYEIDDDGRLATVEADVVDPAGGTLRQTTIAARPGCA